jgi:hypothetical protein
MPEEGKSIGGFLKAQTGPLPNWGWLLVIGGGIAAVYLVPKFLGKSSAKQPDQTSTDAGTGNSGLGLAIDPTTGLPYAVEGLVPSGGVVGTQPDQLPPIPSPTPSPPPPSPTPTPTPPDVGNFPPRPGPQGIPYNPYEPLIPYGRYNGPSYSNLRWGTKYTYNGVEFQLGTGAEGRLWGVPVRPGQTLTQAEWNSTPVAQGKKALLYEPQSAYPYPSTTQVFNTWNGTTQTRIA